MAVNKIITTLYILLATGLSASLIGSDKLGEISDDWTLVGLGVWQARQVPLSAGLRV